MGAQLFSVYTDFGHNHELDIVIRKYKEYFTSRINDNKNSMYNSFRSKDFDKIMPLMQKNELLE